MFWKLEFVPLWLTLQGNNLSVVEFCICLYLIPPTTDNCELRQLYPVESNWIGVCKKYSHGNILPATSVHHACQGQTHWHLLWQLSIRFQILLVPPLQNNSQAATLLIYTSQSTLEVFLKIKFHNHCGIYAFLKYLTCAKLYYHFC